jgi:hypothetical protein
MQMLWKFTTVWSGVLLYTKSVICFRKKKYAHVMEVHICLVLGFIYLYKSYLMFHVQKQMTFPPTKIKIAGHKENSHQVWLRGTGDG